MTEIRPHDGEARDRPEIAHVLGPDRRVVTKCDGADPCIKLQALPEPWLEALLGYLTQSRDLFDARICATIPGARTMPLAATYLAWVDFAGTGLSPEEVAARVKGRARIFASPGSQFGPGGETWLRFNFATPRCLLEEALGRLDEAFADLRQARA